MPQALLGIPHPVDPGEYKFQAFAQGMESAPATVVLREASKETVVLTLRATTGAQTTRAASGGGAGTGQGQADVTADPGTPEKPASGVSGLRIGAYVGFGVGVVGGALGTIFLLQSSSSRSDADAVYNGCPPSTGARACTAEQTQRIANLDSDADGQRNIGVGGLILGGVGLAAGVTLLVLDLNRDEKTARTEPTPQPVIGLGYAGLSGTF
jgi:hypothetical protein